MIDALFSDPNYPAAKKSLNVVAPEAIKLVEHTTGNAIHLRADDLARWRKLNSSIFSGLPESGPLRFTCTCKVSRGGCLIHPSFGLLDACRESKLKPLRLSFVA
jgi:flagellar biosynthesis/type III secretory pathway protein FliH